MKKQTTANGTADLRSTMRAMALFRGLTIINEQLEVQPPAPTGDAMVAPSSPPTTAPTGDVVATPPAASSTTPITVESLVEILNDIRAGRSFDDPAVYASFTSYFNSTPESTRGLLGTELRKIAELVRPQNAAQPENASTPPAAPGVTPPPPVPAQTSPGAPPVPGV